jgi:hypothetical protein
MQEYVVKMGKYDQNRKYGFGGVEIMPVDLGIV